MKMMTSLHIAAAQVYRSSFSRLIDNSCFCVLVLSVSFFVLLVLSCRLLVCVVMEMKHPRWLWRVRGWGLVTVVSW